MTEQEEILWQTFSRLIDAPGNVMGVIVVSPKGGIGNLMIHKSEWLQQKTEENTRELVKIRLANLFRVMDQRA